MENKTAIILAGGSNKRIKMLKPLINVRGKKILIRINDSIKEIFSQILLVVRKNQNDSIVRLGKDLGMEIIEDFEENTGPLAAIYAGLTNSKNNEVFVIGSDYPFLSKDFIFFMLNLSKNKRSVFIEYDKGINPLHAVYLKTQWESVLRKYLRTKSIFSTNKIIQKNKKIEKKIIEYNSLKKSYQNSLFDIDTIEDLSKANNKFSR
ncbi:MAG: NTP transferase domain-containing protein [Chloroflexota bacterium]|nr:NTP transferase domain-containing protein [Chloroflexota bacterium]